MNNSASAIEDPIAQPAAENSTAEPGKYSGIVLPPFDPEGALAALKSLRQGDREEQRETFEIIERALREKEAAHQQAIPGFAFEPIDVDRAFKLLDQLDAFDPAEQRETFEYLRQALNEERSAGGERLLFP